MENPSAENQNSSESPDVPSAEEVEIYIGFAGECNPKIEDLEDLVLSLSPGGIEPELMKSIYRILHTVKGTSASLGLARLAEFTHRFEDYIVPLRDQNHAPTADDITMILGGVEQIKVAMSDLGSGQIPSVQPAFWDGKKAGAKASHSSLDLQASKPEGVSIATSEKKRVVSVDIGLVDELLGYSGNITVLKDLLLQDVEGVARRYPQDASLRKIAQHLQSLDKENECLQRQLGGLRKTNVSSALRGPQRAIRDLSLRLGKKIKFSAIGTNLQIDCDEATVLSDSLVHIARNAVDHGVEAPEQRLSVGKAEEAVVQISIHKVSDGLQVTFADDGRGIDPARIKEKALQKGVVTSERLQSMSSEEILALIFESGFSTAEQVTDVSGRGVGLDMVAKSIAGIGGRVSISSEVGAGTKFLISIPEKKATNILTAFAVRTESSVYAIPREVVVEVRKMAELNTEGRILRRGGRVFVNRQDCFVEIIQLGLEDISTNEFISGNQLVIVLQDGTTTCAVCVDEIVSQEKLIIKDAPPEVLNAGIYEKVALSGKFGLLLLLGLRSALKMRR